MSKLIRKLTTDEGRVFYPATITDAILCPDLKICLSNLIYEFNLSLLFPNEGINSTDRYDIDTAITLIDEKLKDSIKFPGIKLIFLNEENNLETWTFIGNSLAEFKLKEHWILENYIEDKNLPKKDTLDYIRGIDEEGNPALIGKFDLISLINDLNLGYFETEEELKLKHPTAENETIAYVGSNYPYEIWIYKNGWEFSGKYGGQKDLNLDNYYKKSEVDKLILQKNSITPILQTAPDINTKTWVDEETGETFNFNVGQFAKILSNEVETGSILYQFYGLNEQDEAIWVKTNSININNSLVTLPEAPNENTLTWFDGSENVKFKIGQLARVDSGTISTGFIYYRLYDIKDETIAIWKKTDIEYDTVTLPKEPNSSNLTWTDGIITNKFYIGQTVRVFNSTLNSYIFYTLIDINNGNAVWERQVGKLSPDTYTGEVFNDYENNVAGGEYSHAEGYNTKAIGNYSHSEGKETIAEGDSSHSEGLESISIGEGSHAEGYNTKAKGTCSHSEGQETVSSGTNSHSEGMYTVSEGLASHSEGIAGQSEFSFIISSGPSNVSFVVQVSGREVSFKGILIDSENVSNKFKLGDRCYANAWNTVEGAVPVTFKNLSIISGGYILEFTVDEGNDISNWPQNNSTGAGIFFKRQYIGAYGKASHTEGFCNVAYQEGEHAEGVYNKSYESTDIDKRVIHSVGIGESDTNRKNAYEIKFNGDHYIYGIGGYDGTNSGSAKTLQESINEIEDDLNNISDSMVGKKYPNSIGGEIFNDYENNIASGNYSHASGGQIAAVGPYSTVIGYGGAQSTGENDEIGSVGDIWESSYLRSGVLNSNIINVIIQNQEEFNTFKQNFKNLYKHAIYIFNFTKDSSTISIVDSIKEDIIIPSLTSFPYSFRISFKNSHDVINFTSLNIKRYNNQCFGGATGFGSINLGTRNSSIGDYSFAEGFGNRSLGIASHAEGYTTIALGKSSHAEGISEYVNDPSLISEYGLGAFGDYSHSEGSYTHSSGESSHAEGTYTVASGQNSHSEGETTIAIGKNSHIEGIGGNEVNKGKLSSSVTISGNKISNLSSAELAWFISSYVYKLSYNDKYDYFTIQSIVDTSSEKSVTFNKLLSSIVGVLITAEIDVALINGIAYGPNSHAEGKYTSSVGEGSHAEGLNTTSKGEGSHAEGGGTSAIGLYAHAEGVNTIASGNYSHSEGQNCNSTSDCSHAEGMNTLASGSNSHAEGNGSRATGDFSHAEGSTTLAEGQSSHAEGWLTEARGEYSHTSGKGTVAALDGQFILGTYNKIDENSSPDPNIFVIGNGNSSSYRSNSFSVTEYGNVKAVGTFTGGTTADYAEMFEWKDGNPNKEERVGYFVSLNNGKIEKSTSNSKYILGIISATPTILGDNPMDWHDKYLKDDWGRIIYEDVEIIDEITKESKIIKQPKINPEYNSEKEYIERFNRPEWGAVGLMGKLRVRQDGTLSIGKFCKPNDNGIATLSNDESGYYVLDIINDSIALVLFK